MADECSREEHPIALFTSAKTVEATLARVYRKVGSRSRAELGQTMGKGTT
jgi:DNA-binding NarL/FixJ family response regulator